MTENKKEIVEKFEETLKLCRMFANLTVKFGTVKKSKDGCRHSFIECDASAEELPEYIQLVDGREELVCVEGNSGMAIISDMWRGVSRVYDFNRPPKVPYERMEYIARETISFLLEDDRIRSEEVVRFVNEVLELSQTEMSYFSLTKKMR